MPSTSVRGGLYWSDRTKTWHYEFRFLSQKWNGDTGISTSRELAEKWKQKKKEQLAAEGVDLELPAKPSTLREILTAWVKAETGALTQKHLDDRQDLILLHFDAALDDPITSLTTTRMDDFRGDYLAGTWRGKGWGRKTPSRPRTKSGWNRVLRQLKALLRWGIERKLLKKLPFTAKRIKVQKTAKPVVWPEDVPTFLQHLFAAVKSQDVRSACILMLQLGLREDEALGARWEWFIPRLAVYRPEDTKDRDLREIDLPPGLLDYLRHHHGKAKRGFVLPREENGDTPHLGAYTSHAVKAAGKAMGIPGLTPHRLRATFATTHWEAGTSLDKIMAMMGHDDSSTTMVYIVHRKKDNSKAQQKVAGMMGLGSGPLQVPEKPIKKPKKPAPKRSTRTRLAAS